MLSLKSSQYRTPDDQSEATEFINIINWGCDFRQRSTMRRQNALTRYLAAIVELSIEHFSRQYPCRLRTDTPNGGKSHSERMTLATLCRVPASLINMLGDLLGTAANAGPSSSITGTAPPIIWPHDRWRRREGCVS